MGIINSVLNKTYVQQFIDFDWQAWLPQKMQVKRPLQSVARATEKSKHANIHHRGTASLPQATFFEGVPDTNSNLQILYTLCDLITLDDRGPLYDRTCEANGKERSNEP
jgi:hypothetical protein